MSREARGLLERWALCGVLGLMPFLNGLVVRGESAAFEGPVSDLVVSGDSVYYTSPGGLFEWRDGESKQLLDPFGIRLFGIAATGSSPERPLVLVGGVPGESGQLAVFDGGGSETVFVSLSEDLIYDVAFDPVGERFAFACADGRVLLGRLENGKVADVSTRYKHTSVVRSVVFSPDGTHLASAALDGLVLVADLRDENKPIVIQDHSDEVECVVFSPDSQRIVSGSRDSKLRVHSVGGRLIRTYSKWGPLETSRPWSPSNQLLTLCFADDDDIILVGSSQGYLFGLELDSGRSTILKRFPKPISALDRSRALFVGADRLYEIEASILSGLSR